MRKIKEIEYDDIECAGNDDEKCPYCRYDNFVESEDYWGQEEERIAQCGKCEKFYVSIIEYSVSFSTKPYENNFLYIEKGITESIIKYKDCLMDAIDKKDEGQIDYFTSVIKRQYRRLEELAKEAENILGEDVFENPELLK